MKEHINKKATILIKTKDNAYLTFQGLITDITDSHITFIDKHDYLHTFAIEEIRQISEIKEEETK